jgi:hypothetical protein
MYYNSKSCVHVYYVRATPSDQLVENILKKKLRGFSTQANYTDRATATCR